MTTEQPTIDVQRVGTETLLVPIVGTAPLIVHRFSEKAKRQMLDNMQGRKAPKQAKDPEADYLTSFYLLDSGRAPSGIDDVDGEGFGFPTLAFKAATISAARFYDKSVTMTLLRQCLFFAGEVNKAGELLTPITTGQPHCREDVVTVGMKGHDLRYRPQFNDWSALLRITYVRSMLTRDAVVSLVDAGGLGVGVGEWRPEKSGQFGTYAVDTTRDVEVESA